MIERQNLIEFYGKEVTVIGKDIHIGQDAPEFVATTQKWENISVLAYTKNKVRIIVSVPSLDTEVCDRVTRTFNMETSQLSNDITIIVISADLPFSQNRWCGATGVDKIFILSDHKSMDFGEKYACLLKEPRILRRAVFVINKKEKVEYSDYMSDLGLEPDYKAVLRSARNALRI